ALNESHPGVLTSFCHPFEVTVISKERLEGALPPRLIRDIDVKRDNRGHCAYNEKLGRIKTEYIKIALERAEKHSMEQFARPMSRSDLVIVTRPDVSLGRRRQVLRGLEEMADILQREPEAVFLNSNTWGLHDQWWITSYHMLKSITDLDLSCAFYVSPLHRAPTFLLAAFGTPKNRACVGIPHQSQLTSSSRCRGMSHDSNSKTLRREGCRACVQMGDAALASLTVFLDAASTELLRRLANPERRLGVQEGPRVESGKATLGHDGREYATDRYCITSEQYLLYMFNVLCAKLYYVDEVLSQLSMMRGDDLSFVAPDKFVTVEGCPAAHSNARSAFPDIASKTPFEGVFPGAKGGAVCLKQATAKSEYPVGIAELFISGHHDAPLGTQQK
ncbi:hypothetical protein CYMTET_31604, partial [Cymbomonas tetramitiformis]